MNNHNFWTGLADFTTGEMPSNAIGIVARVVTHARDYNEFYEKVRDTSRAMEGKLITIEEPNRVADFLKQRLDEDHEIYELFETAIKFPNDIVYGEFHYYTQNDA